MFSASILTLVNGMLQLPQSLIKLEPVSSPSPYGSFSAGDDPLLISPDEPYTPLAAVPAKISPREPPHSQRLSVRDSVASANGPLRSPPTSSGSTTGSIVSSAAPQTSVHSGSGLLAIKV